jgi:hypothetical protein
MADILVPYKQETLPTVGEVQQPDYAGISLRQQTGQQISNTLDYASERAMEFGKAQSHLWAINESEKVKTEKQEFYTKWQSTVTGLNTQAEQNDLVNGLHEIDKKHIDYSIRNSYAKDFLGQLVADQNKDYIQHAGTVSVQAAHLQAKNIMGSQFDEAKTRGMNAPASEQKKIIDDLVAMQQSSVATMVGKPTYDALLNIELKNYAKTVIGAKLNADPTTAEGKAQIKDVTDNFEKIYSKMLDPDDMKAAEVMLKQKQKAMNVDDAAGIVYKDFNIGTDKPNEAGMFAALANPDYRKKLGISFKESQEIQHGYYTTKQYQGVLEQKEITEDYLRAKNDYDKLVLDKKYAKAEEFAKANFEESEALELITHTHNQLLHDAAAARAARNDNKDQNEKWQLKGEAWIMNHVKPEQYDNALYTYRTGIQGKNKDNYVPEGKNLLDYAVRVAADPQYIKGKKDNIAKLGEVLKIQPGVVPPGPRKPITPEIEQRIRKLTHTQQEANALADQWGYDPNKRAE